MTSFKKIENKENKMPLLTKQAFLLIRKMGVKKATELWTRQKLPFSFFQRAHYYYQDYLNWCNKYATVVSYICNNPRKKIRI